MALNIKNPEATRLIYELAAETGETLTEAVLVAVRERLASVRRSGGREETMEAVRDIQAFVRSLPDRDERSPDEILGYDDHGLPS